MLKPIRIKLPDDMVYRTKPFTVKTFRDLLLIRHQLVGDIDSALAVEETLNDLFPDAPEKYRPYIFLMVYCESRGIDELQLNLPCKHCDKKSIVSVKLRPEPLKSPELKLNDQITLKYKFIDPSDIEDLDFIEIINKSLVSVVIGQEEFDWNLDFSEEDKDLMIDSIDINAYQKYVEGLSTIPKIYIDSLKCCEPAIEDGLIEVPLQTVLDLFLFVLNPEEINLYYRSNRVMVNSGYSMIDIENMVPMEKTITLKLIEGELQRRKEANANIK